MVQRHYRAHRARRAALAMGDRERVRPPSQCGVHLHTLVSADDAHVALQDGVRACAWVACALCALILIIRDTRPPAVQLPPLCAVAAVLTGVATAVLFSCAPKLLI